jgi:hypothetical protein
MDGVQIPASRPALQILLSQGQSFGLAHATAEFMISDLILAIILITGGSSLITDHCSLFSDYRLLDSSSYKSSCKESSITFAHGVAAGFFPGLRKMEDRLVDWTFSL